MKKIAFLHTAEIHVQTFNELAAGTDVELEHLVLPELLARAQSNGLDDVRADTIAALEGLKAADAVICTCSTLGPIADEFSQNEPHITRIDRPLMQAALKHAPYVVVAICLESTRKATLNLLNECAQQAGVAIKPRVILCKDAWAYFEAGDQEKFANSIANQIKIETQNSTGCIILAQASMRVAEPLLQNIGIPVFSSPKLAFESVLQAK